MSTAQFKDFLAALITDDLMRSGRVRVSTRVIEASLDTQGLTDVKDTDYACVLDSDLRLMKRFVQQINVVAQPGETVSIPAVVRLKLEAFQSFTVQVDHPVVEVPTPSPCMAGRQLNDTLVDLLTEVRVDTCDNTTVTGVTSTDGVIIAATMTRAGGNDNIKVDTVVDMAGGFASGNLARDSYMTPHEAIFELPLFTPPTTEKAEIHSADTRQKILVE